MTPKVDALYSGDIPSRKLGTALGGRMAATDRGGLGLGRRPEGYRRRGPLGSEGDGLRGGPARGGLAAGGEQTLIRLEERHFAELPM